MGALRHWPSVPMTAIHSTEGRAGLLWAMKDLVNLGVRRFPDPRLRISARERGIPRVPAPIYRF